MADVGQQRDAGGVRERHGRCQVSSVRCHGGSELVEGVEGEAGPVAAGNFGDGEEWAPVVGQAIEGGVGQFWVAGLDLGEVVLGPAGEFAAKLGCDFDMLFVEASDDLAGFGLDQPDANRAVSQRAGQVADASQDGRSEGFEGPDSVAFAFAAVSAGTAFVSGIQQAAQFFGLGEIRIHFVQQQDGLVLVHEAIEDGGGEVFGAHGPGNHGGEEIDGGGFATALFGRGEVQARAEAEGAKSVGVRGPKGDGMGSTPGQDDIEAEAGGDLVQDFLDVVHGLGPRLDDWKFDG